MSDIPQTLQIRVGEARLYDFDFSQQTEIQAGQTIASVTSLTYTAPGGGSLSVANDHLFVNPIPPNAPIISGAQVQFWIGSVAGAVGTVFNFSCKILTSSGATLIEEGILQIIS